MQRNVLISTGDHESKPLLATEDVVIDISEEKEKNYEFALPKELLFLVLDYLDAREGYGLTLGTTLLEEYCDNPELLDLWECTAHYLEAGRLVKGAYELSYEIKTLVESLAELNIQERLPIIGRALFFLSLFGVGVYAIQDGLGNSPESLGEIFGGLFAVAAGFLCGTAVTVVSADNIRDKKKRKIENNLFFSLPDIIAEEEKAGIYNSIIEQLKKNDMTVSEMSAQIGSLKINEQKKIKSFENLHGKKDFLDPSLYCLLFKKPKPSLIIVEQVNSQVEKITKSCMTH